MSMSLLNLNRGTELAHTVIVADTFLSRLTGLLGRSGLPRGWCLVLKPCRSVHTMFMRFNIDIAFVDKSHHVVQTVHNLAPFCFSGTVRKARLAVELPAGTLALTGTSIGDMVKLESDYIHVRSF